MVSFLLSEPIFIIYYLVSFCQIPPFLLCLKMSANKRRKGKVEKVDWKAISTKRSGALVQAFLQIASA